jgi:LmbE family N-acetylglucosaminyl deacetylase/serine acetyltransferase
MSVGMMSAAWHGVRQAMLRAAWRRLRPSAAPRPQEAFDARSVLVLAPHPDDEAIGCAGTLLRHLAAGATVGVVYLTDGRRGSAAWQADLPAAERDALERRTAAARRIEAEDWAARMRRHANVDDGRLRLHFLKGPDGELAAAPELAAALARVLDAERPAWIYLPSPFDVHPDHVAARALLDAAAGRCTQPHRATLAHYELWAPLPASRVVDITAQLAAKLDALAAHASQLGDTPHADAVAGLNRYRSLALPERRGAAEAFLDEPWRPARARPAASSRAAAREERRMRLAADRQRLAELFAPELGTRGYFDFLCPSWQAVWLHRWSHYFSVTGRPLWARLCWHINMLVTGADISPISNLGPGLLLVHPAGVIMHGSAGKRLTVFGRTGMGGGRSNTDIGAGPGLPLIGDDVRLEYGSCILGPLKVGNRVVVGANAIVHRHLADGETIHAAPTRASVPGKPEAKA